MSDEARLKRIQDMLDISPFQRWLGLRAEQAGEGRLTIGVDWRDDFISNPQGQTMHGGILASLIDLGGLYAILTTGAAAVATVDLRVDYHRPVSREPVRAISRIIKLGSKVSSAETEVFGASGKLLASGRGVYLMRD